MDYNMMYRSNVLASCYVVNSTSAMLRGFHYSSTGAGGESQNAFELSGVPEVSSGLPSPPLSPPLGAAKTSKETTSAVSKRTNSDPSLRSKARRGGAAYTITGECERLFCETLSTVFLGEGNLAGQNSLVMGMHNNLSMNDSDSDSDNGAVADDTVTSRYGHRVTDYLEVYDYAGGAKFKGFVAQDGNTGEKALFVFFDKEVVGHDLKQGLMALLELASLDEFDCTRLIVALDRSTNPGEMRVLMRDLGWVGFEPTTLEPWTGDKKSTSDRWIFMGMDV